MINSTKDINIAKRFQMLKEMIQQLFHIVQPYTLGFGESIDHHRSVA
jgi:hypothetical protein